MNKIPPFDLTRQYQTLEAEINPVVSEVLRSGRYIGGNAVSDFEQAFSEYIGSTHCLGCNSGTDALYLALRAFNIGPGDEVITSPFTFIATAETISEVGATPVFVDIDLETFNLDSGQIEQAITPKTRAIMPVHLFGRPVEMPPLLDIAQQHNLVIIEDCAQATGAEWEGKKVGNLGHVGCFSFFPTKNLGGCGDGGAVTTNDPEIAATVNKLRQHGQPTRYIHDVIGVNSRLDAVQGAILQIKLRHLDSFNQARANIAQRYQELLSPLAHLVLPTAPPQGKAVWNQYTIRVLSEGSENRRDALRMALQEAGIGSMVYYPRPLHLQPVYDHLKATEGSFPKAEQACQEVLSLPMFPELTSEEQEQVVQTLKQFL
ncbi:DegT/DnrJ/EryC1/StrS family aminotransferase [Spirulina sp. CS-785/01]|uniref:DegT/DnrJ/EryC1/StrS family aminotransferase n=1 Tax=Spirulina sp. CS-785/01 TaxID=3021716 RepID=UPI00232E4F22|nr:DegT/DnrJ/EryC1/StrS family aminotransferase [Spirulina sp. CS-785/01]MDB9312105.1 DegT/DnrJ/EryC1/StrS family aminotransferase [Spirulina sp. CS-785/01]